HELPIHRDPAGITRLDRPEARMVTDGRDFDTSTLQTSNQWLVGMPFGLSAIDLNREDGLGHGCLAWCHVGGSACHRTPHIPFHQANGEMHRKKGLISTEDTKSTERAEKEEIVLPSVSFVSSVISVVDPFPVSRHRICIIH